MGDEATGAVSAKAGKERAAIAATKEMGLNIGFLVLMIVILRREDKNFF
jgi:hypothetical protein